VWGGSHPGWTGYRPLRHQAGRRWCRPGWPPAAGWSCSPLVNEPRGQVCGAAVRPYRRGGAIAATSPGWASEVTSHCARSSAEVTCRPPIPHLPSEAARRPSCCGVPGPPVPVGDDCLCGMRVSAGPLHGLVWALRSWAADRGPCRWQGTAARGKEDIPVNKRDKARNTAQTAKGNAKRAAGKAAGESACPG
jgi:hypothetical protein